MSRIAIVGCDASGKTVLISSLSDYYKAGSRAGQSCIMVPSDGATRRYTDNLHRVMRINGEWPEATSDIAGGTSLKWKMMRDSREIADLELLDFGGENFRYAFRDDGTNKNPEVVRQLKEYIAGADFIVITVSMDKMLRNLTPALYRELENGDIEYDRDSEAQWVTDGLLKMVADKVTANPPGVVVALTQADKHRGELDEHGGAKALFAKCWPTIAAMYPALNVVPCASIDRMSGDGLPADGYSTEGVLAVMKEFSRYAFGDGEELCRRLDALQAMISGLDEVKASKAFTAALKDYRHALGSLESTSAITDGVPVDRMAQYGRFLDGVKSREEAAAQAEKLRVEEEARRASRAQAEGAVKHPARVLGLLVILAAVLVVGMQTGSLRLFDFSSIAVDPSAESERAFDLARARELAQAREAVRVQEEARSQAVARAQEAEREHEAALEREKAEREQLRAEMARQEQEHQEELRQRQEQEAALREEQEREQARIREEQERIREEQERKVLEAEEARRRAEEEMKKAQAEAEAKAQEAAEARLRMEEMAAKEAEARSAAEKEAAERAAAEKDAAETRADGERPKRSGDEILRLRAEERELKYQEMRERQRSEREQLETAGLMTSLVDSVNKGYLERGRNLIADLSVDRRLSQGQQETLDYAKVYMDHLEKAQNGNADDMVWVGNQYYTAKDSLGIVKNPREAFDWYQRASAAGSAQAYYFMSLMTEQGEGCRKDEALAGRYCLKAARLGYAEAMFWTGVYFNDGTHGFERSPSTAYKFLSMARSAGFENPNLDNMIRRVKDDSDEDTIDSWFPDDPRLEPVKPEPKSTWWIF